MRQSRFTETRIVPILFSVTIYSEFTRLRIEFERLTKEANMSDSPAAPS